MRLICIRTLYSIESTEGVMLADDQFLGYTLEDIVRSGPKVFGKTAIPEGIYSLVLSFSNHFQKVLPEILDVPGFSGVRIHGGNTADNTEGCILIAKERQGPDRIQGSLSAALVEMMNHAGGTHQIQIINAWRAP